MGASVSTRDRASARELGKITKFLHRHCLRGHEVQIVFCYQLEGFESPHRL